MKIFNHELTVFFVLQKRLFDAFLPLILQIRMAEKELNDARELLRTTIKPPKLKPSSSSSSSSDDDEEVDGNDDDDYDDHHHNCVMNGR